MNCPTCQSAELDSSGNCPVCSRKTTGEPPASESRQEKSESAAVAGLIEIDYASPKTAKSVGSNDLPQWRQDLARRLQEIRQKRGTAENPAESPASPPPPEEAAPPPKPIELRTTPPEIYIVPKPADRPPKAPKAVRPPEPPAIQRRPAPRPAQPAQKPEALPLFQSVESSAVKQVQISETAPANASAAVEPQASEVPKLIDRVVARQAADTFAATPQPVSRIPVTPPPAPLEDRLILVTRTLSGLVDLLVVTMCTGVFIIAADIVSGIHIFDSKSVIAYLALLLSTFFVYSAFFLGTANQTVGMMLTDLRVVDSMERRPGMLRILWRCAAYLLSLLTLGAGLLWGCFDLRGRCLHDRLSDTHVVRL